MSPCTLAALHAALGEPRNAPAQPAALEAWLAQLPDARARAVVWRALTLDAPLIATSFPSMGSCLYARALAEPSLHALASQWAEELKSRGEPWVQALRAMPLPVGLVAQRTVREVPLDTLPQRLQLQWGATLELRCVLESWFPGMTRPNQERVVARWVTTKPKAASQAASRADAKFVKDGWGPTSLVRTPGATPIQLPCPDEGSANAKFSDDGTTLFVYGTYDEYAGGFAKLLDPDTLAVRLSIDTERPVSGLSVCDRPDRVLLSTYGGLVLWTAGKLQPLPIPMNLGDTFQLSPDGEYIATGSVAVQVWSVDEVLASGKGAGEPGFPTVFDPTGARLISHRALYDGRTGEMIARLEPRFSQYLEGGPASPSFQCTERYIINLQNELQMWRTDTGKEVDHTEPVAPFEPITSEETFVSDDSGIGMRFPHWYTLAYDTIGSTLAALRRDSDRVRLYALPPNGQIREVTFETKGCAAALDRDGKRIAIAGVSTLEVRARNGALLRRCSWAEEPSKEASRFRPDVRLLFSHDGARLACSVEKAPWRVWALSGERGDDALAEGVALESLADFAAPALAGWSVEGEERSVFTHVATGTRVAFPAPSTWVVHPADSSVLANPHAHIALR